MTAIFVMANLDYVDKFLCKYDIPNKICACGEFSDEFELRVDIGSLKENQVKVLEDEFNVNIKSYTYLIFWE